MGSSTNPLMPNLSPADIQQAFLLRLSDDLWSKAAMQMEENGELALDDLIDDPVVAQWERELDEELNK